ncbi:MAG: hypothetical protein HRU38_16715 [Saccharospirillaceae bacterium]|nr:hypothetical protein [Pseudomonadales bacterium]NRB80283.1 hypothetical protein [Saccharospirillaceae bacterium]
MLKGMYYFVVALLMGVIVWGFVWILSPEQKQRVEAKQLSTHLLNDETIGDKIIDYEIDDDKSQVNKDVKKESHPIAVKTPVNQTTSHQTTNSQTTNYQLTNNKSSNNKQQTINQQTTNNQTSHNNQTKNRQADSLQQTSNKNDVKLQSDQSESLLEVRWTNDAYLEELVLRHLKLGISEQELEILFARRFEKDISNALVIMMALDYFFPGETLDVRYQHLSSKNYDKKILLASFPLTNIGLFNIQEIQKSIIGLFDNKIPKKAHLFNAYWLVTIQSTFKQLLPTIDKAFLKSLVKPNKNSQNPKINNIAQTFSRYLESNESLIKWIIAGNDQYGSFLYCECLIKSALKMNLSHAQWLILLSYYSDQSPQYTVQIIQRLNNTAINLNLNLNLNLNFNIIWNELVLLHPKLLDYSPLKQIHNSQDIKNDFDVTSKKIIESLWNDFFIGVMDIQQWDNNQLKSVAKGKLDRVIEVMTWADLLSMPQIVFNKKDVLGYFNELSLMNQFYSNKGLNLKLTTTDFWFLNELNALYSEVFQAKNFNAQQIKNRKDELFSQLPIAVRLNELKLDVFLMLFSDDRTLVNTQDIFSIDSNTYNKWDNNIQTGYVFLEFLYRLKNEYGLWQDPNQKRINAETMYELPMMINVVCVLEQYHKPNYQGDLIYDFKQCQYKVSHYFYDVYALVKDEVFENMLFENKDVLNKLDIKSLFNTWDTAGFSLDWFDLMEV